MTWILSSEKEHSIAYRVTKEEALDLPEQTFENRYITLSRSERNLYDRLRRDSYAELADGGTITATTVLTKLLRLQQFTGGFLVEDDAIQPKLVSRGKLDALEDILQDYVVEGKKKLVIFARFIPEIHEIEALCGKTLRSAGMKAVAIYGDIKKRIAETSSSSSRPTRDHGLHRPDRHRRYRHHPDSGRHLHFLQRQLQLRHL